MHRFPRTFLLVLTLLASLPVPVGAVDLDWNTPGSGDFFDMSLWTPNQVPTSADDAYIRNDGNPSALSGGPVEAHSLIIGDAVADGDGDLLVRVDLKVADNLLVAANSSSQEIASTLVTHGGLRVENTALLEVAAGAEEHDFHVGVATMRIGQFANVEGNAIVTLVTTVSLGDDLKIGAATNEGGSLTTHGNADWSRITNLSVAGDMDMALSHYRGQFANASGDTSGGSKFSDITTFDVAGGLGIGRNFYVAGPTDSFRIQHDSDAFPFFRDIDEFHVGADLEIGTAVIDFQTGSQQVIADLDYDVVFERIGSVTVDGDFHQASYRGVDEDSPLKFQQITGFYSTNFDQVGSVTIGGAVNVGVIDIDSSTSTLQTASRYETQTQLGLFASLMTTGEVMRVGVIAGNANLQNASTFGSLPMLASSLTTPELRVGVIDNPGVSGSAVANVNLISGFIDTELLVAGEDSTIQFGLSGLERLALTTFDGTLAAVANTYSAIDAADALLEGSIVSIFNFTPASPGTYSFDLVTTDDLSALDDTTADLSIVNLPAGFCVLFYGVAEESGHDILRLTISTECDHVVPEPATLILLSFGGLALVPCRRRRA